MIKVLMVDDNIKLIDAVKEYFKNNDTIQIIDEAYDGQEGFEKILNNEYDIILLDLIMPKKDGLYVLEQIKEHNLDRKIIVETSYNASEVIREVSEYGVNYFILKPFDLSDLEKKIMDTFKRKNEKSIDFYNSNLQVSISKILHDLGIPSHIKGYQFLRDAVGMVFEKPEMIGGITKELYPELAHKYDTTVSRVERAIRHAVEISWNRGDIDLMDKIFGHSVDIDRAKPTNSEFIVTIADKLRLDFHKVGC
ncbi:MAG: sporulation transcription factor Spo0A [Firmicutes bacterium]|nr:sporulation transcription factor Spo0A [Bacillota bacterium]